MDERAARSFSPRSDVDERGARLALAAVNPNTFAAADDHDDDGDVAIAAAAEAAVDFGGEATADALDGSSDDARDVDDDDDDNDDGAMNDAKNQSASTGNISALADNETIDSRQKDLLTARQVLWSAGDALETSSCRPRPTAGRSTA